MGYGFISIPDRFSLCSIPGGDQGAHDLCVIDGPALLGERGQPTLEKTTNLEKLFCLLL
jgi:hypothetical protein